MQNLRKKFTDMGAYDETSLRAKKELFQELAETERREENQSGFPTAAIVGVVGLLALGAAAFLFMQSKKNTVGGTGG